MLISSFHAALMLIAKYFVINILQNKLVDSSKLLFSELAHRIRQELIMHQLVDSILLVSNLRFFAFFLCVQIITILDRFSARKLMQQSVMDMVLQ